MQRPIARELDLGSVLQLVAAHARTRPGRQLCLGVDRLPSAAEAAADCRLTEQVAALVDDGGSLPFAGVDDALVHLEEGAQVPLEPAGLLTLVVFARRVVALRRRLLAADDALDTLRRLGEELPDLAQLVGWAAPRLGRDGTVPDDASPELARLRRQITRSRQQVLAQLEAIRRQYSDVVTDAPPTVRRDRYCLPVRAATRGQLPGLLLDASGTGATAFVEPLAVVELNNELVDAAGRAAAEERRILAEVAAAFGACRDDLRRAVEIAAELDAAHARVLFGQLVEGCVVTPGGAELVLRGARHPLLDERLAPLRRELFGVGGERRAVPLDLRLPEGVRTLVVSGPNAGGKTVVLKTVGLMVQLAYRGVPLPADDGTAIPAYDRMWCHIGDEQDVSADLSTFSGAMTATAGLLAECGPRTLVLYDELGAGTDPLEGAALGCAILEELTSRGCLTVATTHLAAIAMSATSSVGMDNGAMEYDDEAGRPTFRLRVGRPGRSRGLEIASAVGLPSPVLERASGMLGDDHLVLDRWLRRLEALEGELLAERGELQLRQRRVDERLRHLAGQLEALERKSAEVDRTLASERDTLRARAKNQLDRALELLEAATRDRRPLGKRARAAVRREALDLEPAPTTPPPAEAPASLAPGERVRLVSLGGEGVLEEVRGRQALVVVGSSRMWVAVGDLAAVERGGRTPRAAVEVTVGEPTERELKLLGLDVEEARAELERFLDRALAAGPSRVRVVHGHGTGALRRTVREVCSTHPAVRSFRHPPQHRGGTGVTEVEVG